MSKEITRKLNIHYYYWYCYNVKRNGADSQSERNMVSTDAFNLYEMPRYGFPSTSYTVLLPIAHVDGVQSGDGDAVAYNAYTQTHNKPIVTSLINGQSVSLWVSAISLTASLRAPRTIRTPRDMSGIVWYEYTNVSLNYICDVHHLMVGLENGQFRCSAS